MKTVVFTSDPSVLGTEVDVIDLFKDGSIAVLQGNIDRIKNGDARFLCNTVVKQAHKLKYEDIELPSHFGPHFKLVSDE